MRPTGVDRRPRSQRDQYQKAESFGVLGWTVIILLVGYIGLSCLLARLQDEISTKLSITTGRPVEVKLGNWLTTPGQFIWAHAHLLVGLLLLAVVVIGLYRLHKIIQAD